MSLIEKLSDQLSKEVISFIQSWMMLDKAHELLFHKYRMKLFKIISKDGKSVNEKLHSLCRQTAARCIFDIKEVISDKVMGETVSSYIMAQVIIGLNNHYSKILNLQLDIVEAENETLENKNDNLSEKLKHH